MEYTFGKVFAEAISLGVVVSYDPVSGSLHAVHSSDAVVIPIAVPTTVVTVKALTDPESLDDDAKNYATSVDDESSLSKVTEESQAKWFETVSVKNPFKASPNLGLIALGFMIVAVIIGFISFKKKDQQQGGDYGRR